MKKSDIRGIAGRSIGEIAIIIIGVLIAFQFEEWRGERELREQEIAQLYALQADFTENIKRLQGVIDRQEVVVASQTRLLGIIHGHQDMPDEEALKKLVTDSFMFFRLEEVLGAYQALVSSGDLRLIRDRRLRAAIAQFAGTLGDGYEDEELGLRLRVRLISEMSLSTEILAVLEPNFRADGSLPDSAYDPDFNALLDNRAYRNHLTMLTFIESGQLHFYRGLLASAKTIVGIVDQNL
jgi:hypothetical protein